MIDRIKFFLILHILSRSLHANFLPGKYSIDLDYFDCGCQKLFGCGRIDLISCPVIRLHALKKLYCKFIFIKCMNVDLVRKGKSPVGGPFCVGTAFGLTMLRVRRSVTYNSSMFIRLFDYFFNAYLTK